MQSLRQQQDSSRGNTAISSRSADGIDIPITTQVLDDGSNFGSDMGLRGIAMDNRETRRIEMGAAGDCRGPRGLTSFSIDRACGNVSICSEHGQGQVCRDHIPPPGYFTKGCKK